MIANERNFNFVKEGNLKIPFFQRSYVWKKEHWEKFFNDLYGSYLSKNEHFLGSVVLKRQEKLDNEILVIDGQQRLTTFSILIKALFDNLENDKKQYFQELLFAQYKNDEPRICHSKLDREKFKQIILNISTPNPKEKEGLIGCYNYFLDQISNFIETEKVFEFLRFIVESKMWVAVCLNSNEDEQKIFDSINSTGEKLSATDIIKNSLFDKAIQTLGEEKAMDLYKKFWDEIFEHTDQEKKFWDEEVKKNGRTRSETLLYATALIEGFFNIDKDNLNNLSLLYKHKIQALNSEEQFEEFLFKISKYARIYRELPDIQKDTVLYYEDWNTRFFHIAENTQTSTVIPLVVFLRSYIQEEKILQECYYLLEVLILCNEDTKNYNKFFVKIIEEIIKLSMKEKNIPHFIQSEISKSYYICQDNVREWLYNIYNKDAKLILFWIEAWREYCQKDYKDKVGLQYVYTLEHLMPIKWEKHWKNVGVNKDIANTLINQLGNMTLLKGALNNELKNLDWSTKMNGDGRAKNYIKKNVDLLITKELLDKKEWTSQDIEERTKKLIEDFNRIWNVDILSNDKNK